MTTTPAPLDFLLDLGGEIMPLNRIGTLSADEIMTRPTVAIVGSRACTAYGQHLAAELAGQAAALGMVVISGGAYGIDAAAHRGALDASGQTVAVLACGVDVAYPAGNDRLLAQIAGSGAIVSAYPDGSAPTRHSFLERNRVIAALADYVIVVEASTRSGSLNTARHATELGRPLFAVPGPVTSAQSAGCHGLIRSGAARILTSLDDLDRS